jgi:hypothetical protein
MRLSLRRGNRRALTASLMLVTFVLRALIPPGFMPASSGLLSLEICWEDFPAGVLAQGGPPHAHPTGMDSMGMDPMGMRGGAHRHSSGGPSHREHCVFGTACSAGPIHHLPLPSDVSFAQLLLPVSLVSVAGDVRLVHLPQPRAPPGQLS